jgi:hypothetical protein
MLQRNNYLGCVNSDTIVNLIKYDGGKRTFTNGSLKEFRFVLSKGDYQTC